MKEKEGLKLLNVIGLILILGCIIGSLRAFTQTPVKTSAVGKGQVQPVSGIYKKGRRLTIVASSEIGWKFDHWEGDLTGRQNPIHVVLDNDINVKAIFTKINKQEQIQAKKKEKEINKDNELESKRKEKERRKQAELEKKKEEQERRRQAVLERKRKEEKQRRQAELQRKREEERKRQAELLRKREEEERRRQAEIQRKKEEQRRLTELEKREWEFTFGEGSEDVFKSIDRTFDGGFILAGWTESFDAKGEDAYVVKVNHLGEKEWSKLFGGAEWDRFYSVQQSSDGGYILAGYTTSFGAGNRDGYVVKLDKEGRQAWAKTFGKAQVDYFEEVKEVSDGGYILVGSTSGSGIGERDGYLVKVNKNGDEEWSKILRMSEGNEIYAVESSRDGGLVVVGYSGNYGNYQGYIAKLTSQGDKLWSKDIGGIMDEKFYAIEKSKDDGYLLAGWTESFESGNRDGYLVKVDNQGDEEWTKIFGREDWDIFSDMKVVRNGDIILAGESSSADAKGRDAYIVKLNSSGDKEWQKLRGGQGQDAFEEFEVVDNDYLVLIGYTELEENNYDAYLIKVNLN